MEDKVFDLLEKMYIEFSGRFDTMGKEMDKRFDTIGKEMDKRFDTMGKEMDKRFDAVNDRFDKMENEIKDIKSNMATKDDLNLLGTELHAEIQAVHDEIRETKVDKVDMNKLEKIVAKNTYDIEKLKLA